MLERLMVKLTAAYKAFREPDLITDPFHFDDDFSTFESRRLRYAIFWAMYENTSYNTVHSWVSAYKVSKGLYKYIRDIYNPSYREGEFWKSYLWGGQLDYMAGDGKDDPSALPILTDNDAIREPIGQLWRHSNWQITKDILTLYGATLGDVAIKVIDDTERGRVYLDVLNPSILADVQYDEFGNVKGYVIAELRQDPDSEKTKSVTYQETVFRDGDDVVYQTYRDEQLYPWNGEAAEWAIPYGFVPLVTIQHNNVGLDWGWSELQPSMSKINEIDDLTSKLHDQIRKTVDAPAILSGVSKPTAAPSTAGKAKTDTIPQPGREELPILYAPQGNAAYIPMVAPLDIPAVSAEIVNVLKEIERDHPELQTDIWTSQSNDPSGRALRIAREPVENKVNQRRPNYDNGLVRAQQMALSIGGYRGYEGYQGISLDSFEAGLLDHNIANRPVFRADPLDQLELQEKKFTLGNIPTRRRWRELGYDEKEIAEMEAEPEVASQRALLAQLDPNSQLMNEDVEEDEPNPT